MTNNEIRKNDETRMTKNSMRTISDFVIRAFFIIRYSSFVIFLLLASCASRENATQTRGENFSETKNASAINLRQMIVPPGRYGRHIEFPLHASYITIHSTD